jgi:DnaJ-class molecular chaperone
LAKQYHPDTNKAPDAKEKFVEIQNAYEILSDEQKRAQYDQFGHAQDSGTDKLKEDLAAIHKDLMDLEGFPVVEADLTH